MLWRVYGKTFKNICWYRYSYASKTKEREQRELQGKDTDRIFANYLVGFHDIPNKELRRYPLFDAQTTLARDVDYDSIVYDTYDYLDKLIGFKLSDVYYAALKKYYLSNQDERALKLAKYILDRHIEKIDEEQIVFKPSINNIPEEDRAVVNRFM